MYEIFEALLREYNVKTSNVSKATGIAPSTFSDWKSGRSAPKGDKLNKIADYFGIPVEAFYSDISELPNYMRKRERRPVRQTAGFLVRLSEDPELYALVERISKCPEDQRERLIKMMDLLEM